MELIRKAIETNRPNLSASSVDTYLAGMKTISNLIDKKLEKPDDFVTHHAVILEKLSNFKPSTRKSRVAGIISILSSSDASEKAKDAIKTYREQMVKDSETVEMRMRNQELTPEQAENFMSWDDIQKIFKGVKAIAFPLMKLPPESIKIKQIQRIQNFVLLSLYIVIAPRRSKDYTSFKLRNYNEETDNYMVLPPNNKHLAKFVFNTYKNQHKVGRQEIEIPNVLKKVILDWMKINKTDYLLINQKNKPFTITRLNEVLNEIFDSKVSTTLLRHAYLTAKFGNVDLDALEQATTDMGNSEISRTLKYVSKVNK